MGSRRSGGRETSARLRKRLEQIRACEQSGETLKAYAARHGISVHSLYQAKKQARKRGLLSAHGTPRARATRPKRAPRPRFVEAVASAIDSAPALAWRLRLRSGDVLESSTPLDADVTLRLIEALRARP